MREKLRKVMKHPLISGSTILFIGLGAANLFSYLFNLIMGRMLSVSDYGTLAVLLSIINISHVFSSSVATVFTKFTASFAGKKQDELLLTLFKKGNVWIGFGGIVSTASILLLDNSIAGFINIENVLLIDIVSLIIFCILVSSVSYGVLQGQLRFVFYSLIMLFSSVLKFALGVGLVFLGMNAVGATLAILISSLAEFIFLFFLLRRSLKKTSKKDLIIPHLYRQLSLYGLPVLLTGLGMTALITIDIILIKHFLSPVVAGQYAALSIMGRSIFYLILPILSVLFPVIAQKHARQEKLFGTVLLSFFLIGGISIPIGAVYFFFPDIVLKIFFPKETYASLAPHLGAFAIFIIIYSFAWLFKSFYLSIGATRIFIFTLTAAFLEGLFITFFHNDISQIIFGMTGISFLLLICLLLYYPRAIASRKI